MAFSLLRHFCVCVAVVSCVYTYAQNPSLPSRLPGRIIIHYEKTIEADARGQEVSVEHQRLANLISKRLKTNIKKVQPVFQTLVDQMIGANKTETELTDTHKAQVDDKRNVAKKFSLSRTIVLSFEDENDDLQRLLDHLNADKEFEGFKIIQAEPVELSYTTLTPNDPQYSNQWAHRVTEAAKAWDIETGDAAAVIAIIDSGIDKNHEDLKNNIHPKAYDFVDIDTEAYRSSGYQLIAGEDYTLPDNDPMDYNGHGTHVAGIAGASGNNGIGIAGICHSCSILPVRAGFSILYGGYEYGILSNDNIANAIIYAADNGATVINMSFGGGGSYLMKQAIDYAYSKGVLLIASAGNSGSNSISYPGGYDNVIAVASSDDDDTRSYFSTYGAWVDVTAPGGSILSTIPRVGGRNANASGYSVLSGTSMAAPYVAGLAALLKSKNAAYTRDDIITLIQNTCDNIDAKNPTYKSMLGSGRVNASKAINAAPGPNIILHSSAFAEITGNKNGIINAGESVSLTIAVKNTWQNANAVTATLTSTDPLITLNISVTDFLAISKGTVKDNSKAPFTFDVSAATPDQRIIQFDLRIAYDGVEKHIPLNLQVLASRKLEVPKAYLTIQAAINAAKSGDEIIVSPGVYYENIDFIGKNVSVVSLAQSTGDLTYLDKTIIDGSRPTNIYQSSVVSFRNGENNQAVLSGFTIRGGNGNSGSSYAGGGGIYCVNAGPTLRHLIVRDNTLTRGGSGGGILLINGLASLNNIALQDNKHSASIYISGVRNTNTLTLENIHVNRSIDADGIYISSAVIKAKEVTIEKCLGTVASGLMAINATVDIDSARIMDNNKGIDVRSSPRFTLRNAVVAKNGIGGGIWCSNASVLELINVTVADNKISNHYGGAGIFFTDGLSKATSVNSIFYNNIWTELNTGVVRANSISFLSNGGELNVAFSNLEGGREGLKFFGGSSNVKVNWLDGNINSEPKFFRPSSNDYNLSAGSPCIAAGIAHFTYNGKVYVDLQRYQYSHPSPNMGAYLDNSAYIRAAFKADKVLGSAPLTVQFTDESYGYETSAVSSWTWDFGDGTKANVRNPQHVYTKKGEYTVQLFAGNNMHADDEIKTAFIKVSGIDTIYVSTTGSNTTGKGSKLLPYKTIQFAINRANNGDLILVSDGTYRENINFSGKHVRVSSHFFADRNESHITSTIIDGSGNGRVVIFSTGENENSGLAGLTIQNGFANGNNYPAYYGGGIYIENSSPTLQDVIVKNNRANYRGGGIYIDNGAPRLERVTIAANQSIYNFGEGGGIYISRSKAVIKDSRITFNASNYNGGGLFLGYLANPVIQKLEVAYNTAAASGGGIHIESNNLSLASLIVLGNNAPMGGGICSSFSNSTITNSVIARNIASRSGGGFYYLGNSANPKLDKVTIYHNSAAAGKDIATDGSAKVSVSNSIIWNDTSPLIAGTAIITYSDVKGGFIGTGNINADPKLLAPYGNDFSLDFTSPCIDAGDPSSTLDPNGSRADIGAYYYARPIIEGTILPITLEEDGEKQLKAADLKVKNAGIDYPNGYMLKLASGENFTIAGTKIKPALNYFGPLYVPVTVFKGELVSQTYHLLVTVSPINDAPVISGQQKVSTDEDEKRLISTLDLVVSDVDNTVSPSYIVKVRSGVNYTGSDNAVTPAKDFSGNLSVPVTISDGISESLPFNVQVFVVPVNDAPKIKGQRLLTTNEDSIFMLSISDLVVEDPDNAVTQQSFRVMPGSQYSADGSTITPAKDFYGTLEMPVTVSDGVAVSEVFLLKLSVINVNDAPTILGQYPLVVQEDHELAIRVSDLLYQDIDEKKEVMHLQLEPGENYSISEAKIKPSQDYYGRLRIPVTILDGEQKSNVFELEIDVAPINDRPTITSAIHLFVETNASLVLLPEYLTVVDPDTDAKDLTVKLLNGSDYKISDLTITPKTNFAGTFIVGVQVSDGTSTSDIFYLTIEATPITALEEDLNSMFQVYPNPAKNFVHLENLTQKSLTLELQLVGIDGKKYAIAPLFEANGASIDISHLHSGTYFLCVPTTSGVRWKKIAVAR